VAFVQALKEDKFALYSYNFFRPTTDSNYSQAVEVKYIWSCSSPIKQIDKIFTSQKDFQGHHFTVTNMPWSHHVAAQEVSNGTSLTYEGHYGYEVDLLITVR
jgi:hypothetical protein